MNRYKRPVLFTVIYGGICSLLFLFLGNGFMFSQWWGLIFSMLMALYISVYSFVLTRWTSRDNSELFFPVALIVSSIFLAKSLGAYLLFIIFVFSWIRSRICFRKTLSVTIFAEILLAGSSVILVAYLSPVSSITWTLSIWIFFLINSLYFLFFVNDRNLEAGPNKEDQFTRAQYEAEKILRAL